MTKSPKLMKFDKKIRLELKQGKMAASNNGQEIKLLDAIQEILNRSQMLNK